VIITYKSCPKTRKAHFSPVAKKIFLGDIMAYPQVRVNWTVEVNEPDPDIIEVLLPQSQKVLKEVLSTKNGKRNQYNKMTDEDKRKRLDDSKVHRSNLTTGFNLLMKCVPGTKNLNRPKILVSTVNCIRELENYIRELEECIEKKINYTSPLPMECTQLFSGPTD
jgi:hypothetical protein